MNRTFKGFLKAYCAELSGVETTSLRTLLRCALGPSPRVAEPLFCLAASQGKTDYLLSLAERTALAGEYRSLSALLADSPNLETFLAGPSAPKRYAAVLDAFHAYDDSLASDRRLNALLRLRILDELARSGKTRYRLARELGLNLGNVYAYLAGDDAKVSHKTAQRMLEHAAR